MACCAGVLFIKCGAGMQLWLEHLVYCASGGNGESRLFLRKDGEWRFPPLAAEQALHYLSQLIEGIVKECPRHCWCYLKVAARG